MSLMSLSNILFPDVLRAKCPLPLYIHPLEVLVEAKLIAFSNTPFELTKVCFDESLHAFGPRAFELFRDSLKGFPQVLSLRVGA